MELYDSDFNMRKQFYEESKKVSQTPKFYVQEAYLIKGMSKDELYKQFADYIWYIKGMPDDDGGEAYLVTFRRPVHKDYLLTRLGKRGVRDAGED